MTITTRITAGQLNAGHVGKKIRLHLNGGKDMHEGSIVSLTMSEVMTDTDEPAVRVHTWLKTGTDDDGFILLDFSVPTTDEVEVLS